jgi:hypothetical protein
MIDSNTAITVTFTLAKVGKNVLYQQTTLEKLLDAMKRQGIEQEDFWKGFA